MKDLPDIECMTNYDGIIDKYLPTLPEGDFAEFGCYNGMSVANIARKYKRLTWAFDTFDGIPDKDFVKDLDIDNLPGKFKPKHDAVGYLTKLPNVIPMVGRFLHTLPKIPTPVKFALVYIDCDYYNSHIQVLNYLEHCNHLQAGTLFIFDDYEHLSGAKKAINEWKGTMALIENCKAIIYDPSNRISKPTEATCSD